MKKALIAALVVVLLAGAAVAAVPLVEQHAAAQIKQDVERDGVTKVDAVEVGLFARRIALTNLRSTRVGQMSVGHWEASGIAWPLSELMQGRTPAAGLHLGDPLQADRLALRDLHFLEDKVDWSVGSLVIEGFDLARYDGAANGPNAGGILAARIAAALTIGRLEQKNTKIADGRDGSGAAIAGLTIAHFDKGLVGSLVVAGFEVAPKAAKGPVFRIADINITNFDLRRAVRTIGSPGWRPGRPVGRLDVDAASISGFSGSALTRYGISLDKIVSESKREGPDVRQARTRIEGFVLAPPARGLETLQLRIVLQAMGLKDLRLQLDCGGSEDRAKGEVAIDRCVLVGQELGEIALSARLVKADEAFWQAVDEHNMPALMRSKAGLSGAKLVIADRGLVERSLKAVATTSGQPLATVRAGFAQEIRRFQPPNVLITEDMTKLLDTVARFVESGGTLAVEAKPDSPIGVDKIPYLSRPGPDLVNVLGLTATLSR